MIPPDTLEAMARRAAKIAGVHVVAGEVEDVLPVVRLVLTARITKRGTAGARFVSAARAALHAAKFRGHRVELVQVYEPGATP